jgi:hypothetical protein
MDESIGRGQNMTQMPVAIGLFLLTSLAGCGWLNPQEGAAHIGTWSVVVEHVDKNELAFHVENHEEGRPDNWARGLVCLWAIEWDRSLRPYPGYEGCCRAGGAYEPVRVDMKGKEGMAKIRIFATYRFSKPGEEFQDHWYREVAHAQIEVK